MSRWFRFYDDAINDPKLLKLSDRSHRVWMGMLCLASKNDGKLPPFDDMVLLLRTKADKLQPEIEKLIEAGLLDHDDAGIAPHNWNGRQFKSDTSNERVKQHRQRNRNVTSPVTVTPPETEQIQNRTEPDTRDDFRKRVGNLQQAIVKAFADANSTRLPDTSQAEIWLAQGFQEDIILAVVAAGVKKRPEVGTLAYWNNSVKEAHASKAPPRQPVVMAAEQVDWETTLRLYANTGKWSQWAGPDPEHPGCKAPTELLAKYGLNKSREGPAFKPRVQSMQ